MSAVFSDGSLRGGLPVRGGAVAFDEAADCSERTAMSAGLLVVPAVDTKENEYDHDDQGEVDDGHRRCLADESRLQVVHEHGAGRRLVAGPAARHFPDDRK